MRVRSSHIVGIVFLVIVAFVIAAALLDRGRETPGTGAAAALQGPPAIRLERDTLNMGVISNTEPTTMPFTVRNVGGQPLRILSASGSCPCTWAEVEDREVPPGGSTTLHVTMDPFQIAGFESSKSVSIRSNDPARRVTVFKVVCEVEPEFYLEPLSLDFGERVKGDEAEVSMMLRQVREEPVEIVRLKHAGREPEGVEITYEKLPEETWQTPGKAEWRITARLKPDVPAGKIIHYFDIITNVERLASGMRTAVTGQISTFYRLVPTSVLPLQAISPGQTDAGVVTVSSDSPIAVSDVAFTDPRLTATVRSEDEGRRAVISIGASQDAEPGRLDGRVSFTVAGPDQTVQESLRLMGVVRARPEPAP